MYRRIAGHRGTEGISRVVLIFPVIEVVARLVGGLCRSCEARVAVGNVRVLYQLRILMTCIRIRRILHRHGIAVNLPLRVQGGVRMNRRRAKRKLASRRIRPVEEVIARLLSRRRGRDARRIVLNRRRRRIVAVAHALVCRRVAAALCVVLHREARQGIAVLKLQLGRRGACTAALLRDTSRYREGISRARTERTRALRHRKGNRVDCRIVAVVLRRARGLLEGINIGSREAKGKEACREVCNRGRSCSRRLAARSRNLQLCARKRIAHGSRTRGHRDTGSGTAARDHRKHCRGSGRGRDRL